MAGKAGRKAGRRVRMSYEQWEEFLKALEELKRRVEDGWVVIVEGARDREALIRMGIEGEIVTFTGFSETAEKVGSRKVVILTDFDFRGGEIERGLVRCLSSYGNVPDTEIRRRIFCAVKKEAVHVESLARVYHLYTSAYSL